jgi:hypothetical protein
VPKLNFTDIGDLMDYRYQVRTILSIDSATDTAILASVNATNMSSAYGEETALIFYH